MFKVEPGCSLTVRDGTVRHERYWDLAFPPPDRAPPAFPEACERLRDLLAASVRRRLLSDVPLGVFLSGGVDSSSVAALLARSGAAPVVDTFSVGFADPSFDESRHAARVAARLGTRHHDRLLDEATMLRLLPGIVSRLDEPLADNSLVPTYFLARFARERVTVALGGDGGDELLLGYPTFAAHGIARLCGVLPASWRALGARLADLLPVSTANVSLDFRARRFAHGLRYERFDRHFVWIGGLPPDEHAALLAPDWARRATGDPFAPVHRHLARCRPRDDADALSYLYAKIYLGDDILAKVDRATMMNSLEARAPFLEPELAEFLAGLPTSYKLRGFETKRVLKRALEPWVGRDVVRRAKKGFGLPVAAWLKAPLREWASDLLSRRNLERWGHFAPGRVEALWQEHLSGRRDNRKVLWSLLVFLLWLDANLGRARA